MNLFSFIDQVHAAHALSSAMASGVKPEKKHLKSLGLPDDLAKRFTRAAR